MKPPSISSKKMLRGIGKDMPNYPKTGSIARVWSLFRGYNGASFPMKWSLFSDAAEHLFKVSGILFSLARARTFNLLLFPFLLFRVNKDTKNWAQNEAINTD